MLQRQLALTAASIVLNANRAAPQWENTRSSWAGVGANANRYACTISIEAVSADYSHYRTKQGPKHSRKGQQRIETRHIGSGREQIRRTGQHP